VSTTRDVLFTVIGVTGRRGDHVHKRVVPRVFSKGCVNVIIQHHRMEGAIARVRHSIYEIVGDCRHVLGVKGGKVAMMANTAGPETVGLGTSTMEWVMTRTMVHRAVV